MDWTFYVSIALLALFPIITGALDYPEKILEFFDRKRAEDRRRLRHSIWVEHHGVGFLRKLGELGDMEVWIMSETLIHRKNRLARRRGDPAIQALRKRGYVEAACALDFAGFPFYFTERAWCLMTEYKDDVIAERERRRATGLTGVLHSSLHDTLIQNDKLLFERPN